MLALPSAYHVHHVMQAPEEPGRCHSQGGEAPRAERAHDAYAGAQSHVHSSSTRTVAAHLQPLKHSEPRSFLHLNTPFNNNRQHAPCLHRVRPISNLQAAQPAGRWPCGSLPPMESRTVPGTLQSDHSWDAAAAPDLQEGYALPVGWSSAAASAAVMQWPDGSCRYASLRAGMPVSSGRSC